MGGPGSFFGIEIARRGIMAHQKSLETTSHNIANAENPEYSRQEAVHSASSPYAKPSLNSSASPGQLGTGVEIEQVRRIRNDYLDTQYRDANSSKEYYESKQKILEQVESIFPEPDGRGIQDTMVDFFSNWHDLNNNPQDAGVKAAVVETGREMARMFRDSNTQLNNVQESIIGGAGAGDDIEEGRIYDQVNKISDLAEEIKDLTDKIIDVERQGQQPNDLLDKRDAKLDELSEYGPIKVEDTGEHGGIEVTMFPGETSEKLVSTADDEFNEVEASINSSGDIEIEIGGAATVSLSSLSDNGQGSLTGLVSALKDTDDFIADLDKLARELADAVNTEYDPDDASKPQNFWGEFKDENGNTVTGDDRTAGQLYVNSDLVEKPSGLEGEEALNVARLRNEEIIDNNTTLEGYYESIISEIGSKVDSARNTAENQGAILNQAENMRESTSGVSLDEELSNMIQFQRGYQASARMMTVMDNMLDTLINRMAV